MTKIFKQLARHWAVCLVVFALLFVQAYCDLSLPDYTSKIVDTGIQQGGIESPLPDTVRQSTLDALSLLMREEDAAAFQNAYTADGDVLRLRTDLTADERTALEDAVTTPDIVLYLAAVQAANTPAGQTGMGMTGLADLQASGADRNTDTETETVAPTAEDLDTVCGQFAAMSQTPGFSRDAVQQQLTGAIGQLDDTVVENLKSQALLLVGLEYEAQGIAHDVQMHYLYKVGGQMLALTLLMVAVSIAVGFLASRVSAAIGRDLRRETFSSVIHFSHAEIENFSTASLITRTTNDIQQVQFVCVMLLRMVAYAPILGIGGVLHVLNSSTGLSWIIVLDVAVLLLLILFLMNIAMPKFKIMQKLIDRVNLVSREMLTGMSVIRAFDRQEYEEARFDEASTALYKTQLFTNRVMTFMMPTMMLVMNGVSVLIVWVGGSYIDSGVIQTGDMIAFITYSMVIVMSFLMISMIAIMLPRADVAAQRVNEVLDTENSIHDPEESQVEKLDKNAKGLSVEFDNVTFAYNEGSDPVLKDISFVAEPGKTTAIIGSTGSGKSTIMKLIERFYEVTQGAIRVGGVDVRSMKQHELRRELGYVPQKAFLFSGTIESTIAYANEDMDEDRVRKAADIAQATEFITAKEQGFESEISQGGTNVSGGQRQRLSIARALASDARVLLFDDSFSALDYATDARLRHALATEAVGKTVLVVAQRIATVLNADKILVLEDGELVGSGTHKELLSTCPTYREIAQSQLSEEELKGGVA